MSRRIITIIAIVVIVFVGGLSTILINAAQRRFTPLSGGPETTLSVSGNGGPAVSVGGYLFFAGNFIARSEIQYRQNEHNRLSHNDRANYGAIYRVRLNEFGRPDYDNSWLAEDGELRHNDDILNAEHYGAAWNTRARDMHVVVPKIAGFEEAAIWVFGDYLIYTSPNNLMNRQGQLNSALTDFFRVRLDGSGHRRLFTTSTANLTQDHWTVGWANGQSFLIVNDGGRLVHVGVSRNPGRVTELASEVQSVAMPRVTSYFESSNITNHKGFGGVMSYVYWTEARDEDEQDRGIQGNILRRAPLYSARPEVIGDMIGAHYVAHSVSGGLFMFERTHEDEGSILFAADRDDRNMFINTHPNAVDRNAVVRNHFQALDIFQDSENFFAATETGGGVQPMFFSQSANNILRYVRNTNVNDQNRFVFDMNGPFGGIVATDVSEIIKVGANRIYYMSDSGAVTVVDFMGNFLGGGGTPQDREMGLRVGALQTVGRAGERIGNAFFYMRSITEVMDFTHDEDGNVIENPMTMTVPVLVDSLGNTWLLAILDEEFVDKSSFR